MNAKTLLKYFLAGGLGGGIISYIFAYLPFTGYLYLPYVSMIFSIFSGVATLVAGIILDFIFKD
ncbi:MAG: hypothetical protein QXP77_00810 [Candidatus Aenigmatarchaeota archaeon]